MWNICVLCALLAPIVKARGLLLLYRPKDISNDCVLSHQLRYDLSFGMGMSDTITLVFRNLKEIDYECTVEIVTDDVYLLIVIRFPNSIGTNCAANGEAITVLKKNRCLRICDMTADRDTNSAYFIISVKNRIRFRYLSNSSINTDMNANIYQVTGTAARVMPDEGCIGRNESTCIVKDRAYCFTSGVVCDGIKNCGVSNWFDERKIDCDLPVERIGYAPVIAVVAVLLCLILAVSHLLLRYLPPLAHSFFIFNANEDNRLCIDTVFKPPETVREEERAKKQSLIPVSSSSSDCDIMTESDRHYGEVPGEMRILSVPKTEESTEVPPVQSDPKTAKNNRKQTKIRSVAEILQNRLRSVVIGKLRNVDVSGDESGVPK